MKRFISILLVSLALVSIAATALAYTGQVVNCPANTWKSASGYVQRVASGSYWKANYTGGSPSTSTAYLYKQNGDRCTHIETFTKNSERTGLNYLSGQAVTGAYYKLNVYVTQAGTVDYTFNP